MDKELPQDSYHLYITDKCNLSCPICITESGHNDYYQDISIEQIKKILKEKGKRRFVLFGGEPTCHSRLPEIISLLKQNGHTVMMCTNGVKLANYKYLEELVKAGLKRVDLQLDGFNREVYLKTRNADLLGVKLEALENLRKLNLPTGLSMLVKKDLNLDQIKLMIDYSVKNQFIKNISFLSLTFMGKASQYPLDQYIFPDQIVDMVIEQTEGKIKRENLLYYQKAFNAYSSLIKKRRCFYYQSYILVRSKNGYQTIDEILDFKKMDYELKKYAKYIKSNKLLANLYLIKGFLKICLYAILRPKGLRLLFDVFGVVFSYALPSGDYNQSDRLLNLIFTTACDPFKMDSDVGKYCHRGIFYVKEQKVNRVDFRFNYNIDKEKDARLK
ncbi:MAG: radical SAM protein [Candidatus Omnitrophota bacterium]